MYQAMHFNDFKIRLAIQATTRTLLTRTIKISKASALESKKETKTKAEEKQKLR